MVRFGVDLAALTASAVPVALTFSIVRHDAFDIDRLISATATFAIALAILLGGLLAVAPGAAAVLAASTGIDREAGQLVFAALAALALLPLTRAIRPRVDALLYPERQTMERGFQALLADLSQPAEGETPVAVARSPHRRPRRGPQQRPLCPRSGRLRPGAARRRRRGGTRPSGPDHRDRHRGPPIADGPR